jgi:DNA-binding LytR/AlgR family response regulator
MTAVIIEDELIVAEHLTSILENQNVTVLKKANNYKDGLKSIALKADLYILDINLNDENNGVQIAEQLREKKIPFVFITANNDIQTLKKAVKTNPVGYITKPFKNRDIIAILELFKLNNTSKKNLKISTHNRYIYLDQKDILYCKANGSYTDIFTKDTKYTQRINLKDLHEQLNTNFKRIHRSYLVNNLKIVHQTTSELIINQTKIPISKSYKENL